MTSMTVDMEHRRTTVSREIAAPPDVIFAVLADASLHPVIDGSGTVRRSRGPTRPWSWARSSACACGWACRT